MLIEGGPNRELTPLLRRLPRIGRRIAVAGFTGTGTQELMPQIDELGDITFARGVVRPDQEGHTENRRTGDHKYTEPTSTSGCVPLHMLILSWVLNCF